MRMRLPTLLAALLALGAVVPGVAPAWAQQPGTGESPGHHRGFGDPGGFRNILPPGQDGVLNATETARAQAGSVPEHVDDQLGPYAELIRHAPGTTGGDLDALFKDASFGVPPDAVGRVYAPGGRDDVTVVRDTRDGVPHIFGDTREGAMFARGYTAAEDRLFLMDVLRHVGRAELSAFLGPSEANRAMDRDQLAAAPYLEEQLTAQVEALDNAGDPRLRQVVADGRDYVAGVNRYISEALTDPSKLPGEYVALQRTPDEFVPEDIVAVASLVGGIFGKGGGREVANYCGLQQLEASVGGPSAARAVFEDLKLADDPEAPRTAPTGRFPYLQRGEVDPASVPALDCDSLRPLQAPPPTDPRVGERLVHDLVPDPPLPGAGDGPSLPGGGSIDLPGDAGTLDLTPGTSNALLVGGRHTGSGNPIAVFGPQTSYYAPQLLSEFDIHAPGISARGVAFAGTDIYVQLGRGRDYAWSATSAAADLVDQFVLELCEPGGGEPTVESMGYRHDGRCRQLIPRQEVSVAKSSAGGLPVDPADPDPGQVGPDDVIINTYFETAPDYGFVTARGTTTDGTPVAVVDSRSTYGSELASARGFQRLNDPDAMAGGVEDFRQAAGSGIDFTFNWFFVDRDDIGYQVSCRCPRRAAGTDPYLPTWGTGRWDWQGFLAPSELPNTVNPEQGWLVSWNNKQARGFRSNDGEFGYGPVHRSLLLEERLKAQLADPPVTVGEAVDVTALAATTDLRAQELVPLLGRVMRGRAPAGTDQRTRRMLDELQAWAADDHGHRRDHDGDGAYEHASAIAVMDAWWGGLPAGQSPHTGARLYDAAMGPAGTAARQALGLAVHDPPQLHRGSAFLGGLYGQVDKALRQALGGRVRAPLSRPYCGGGDLRACAAALWESLAATGDALEQEFGSGAVGDWARVPADDEIRHTPIGVTGVAAIDWQNRPTFQQVVQVPARGSGGADQPAGGADRGPERPAPDPGADRRAQPPAADDRPAGAAPPTPATGGSAVLAAALMLGLAGALRRR